MRGKHLHQLVILGGFVASCWAQTPITNIFSTGFETPDYLPGSLNGQQSWSGNFATVQSAVVRQGTQAVRLDAGSGRGVSRAVAFNIGSRPDNVVRLRVDTYLATGGTPEYWTVLAVPFSSTRIDINVDETSQIVVFDGTPHFTQLRVPRDSWHQFGNILDFGSRRYDITLDGVVVYTGTLPGNDSALNRVDFFGQNTGSQLAYWDNLSITADPRASQSATLTSGPNPSALGQPVTLIAQLPVRVSRPTSGAAPSGRVTFMDGSIALGSAPVLAGTASTAVSSLGPGSHQLRFYYSGDPDYAPLTSPAVTHSVTLNAPSRFLSAVSYPAGTNPRSIASSAGDLLVANYSAAPQGGFTTLPALGGGKFGAPAFTLVGPSISNVGVADLNGDSSPDYFLPGNTALFISQGTPPSSSITLRNAFPVNVPARTVGAGAVATDLNRDGLVDLVTGGIGGNGGYLSVLLGKSAAPIDFLPYEQFAADSPTFVTSGDFNGDGWPDIAVANSGGANTAGSVAIYLNNGGVLAPPVKYLGDAYTVYAVDVNRDGRLDLVTATGSAPTIGVLIGNGDGTFQPAVYYTTRGNGTFHALPVDFGNGSADLFVASSNANTVEWLTNNGSGGFSSRGVWTVGQRPNSLTAGDFNSDGLLDLAAANSDGTVSVLLGAQNATASAIVLDSAPNPSVRGQAVTLTATVTPSTANGTVTFFDGTNPLGPAASLANGNVTLIVSTLPVGSRQLTAAYSGDAQNASSTSTVLTQMVSDSITPVITGLTPTFISAGSPGFSLVVSGRGFCSASRVRWSATDLATTAGNSGLAAVVPADLIAAPSVLLVTVVNPAVSGCSAGTSPAVSFTVAPSLLPGNESLVVRKAVRVSFDPANSQKQTVSLPVRTIAGGIPQQPALASAVTISGSNWLTITRRTADAVEIQLDPANLGKGTFLGWITYSSATDAKLASGARAADSDCKQKSTRVEFSDSSAIISFQKSPLSLASALLTSSTAVDPVGSTVALPILVTASTEEGGGAPCWLSFGAPDSLDGRLSTGNRIDVQASLAGLAPGSMHTGRLTATSGKNGALLEVNLLTGRALDAGDGSVEVRDDNPAAPVDVKAVEPDAATGTKDGNRFAAGSRMASVAVPYTAVCRGCGKAFTVENSSGMTPARVTVRVDPKLTDTAVGTLEISSPGLDVVSLPVVYKRGPAPIVDAPVITGIGQAFDNSSRLSSNTFIQIYGTGLGPDICVFPRCDWGSSFVNNRAPISLQGSQVLVNGSQAFVSYVSPKQINALTPDDPFVGDVSVQVIVNGVASNKFTVRKSAATPALFTTSLFLINGRQYMAARIADSSAAWVAPGPITGLTTRSARVGEFITVFAVGCGAGSTNPAVGQLYNGFSPLAGAVNFRIGNVPVVEATGFLPGGLAGLCQFNLKIPAGTPSGSQPVTLQIGAAAVTQTLYTSIQ